MSVLGVSHRPSARRWPWARLLEERFTNIDIVVLVCSVLITGFIGVLSGSALVR